MLAGILGMLQAVKAEETYHINRTFTPVEFNLQGTPTVDQLFTESMKLTDTVRGDPIVIDSNGTYAIEQQTAIALGYDTAEAAWNAVLNYQGTPSNYPGKIYDNVGWVRGTKSVQGEWGAYLWVFQNRIAFQSSTSVWWKASSNGVPVMITNVIVGSLGNYAPMSNVVDIGPHLNAATNNSPGANQSESREFYVDITNIFYQLSIPDIWITPKYAIRCVGGSNVQYSVAGTNIPNGVTWLLNPDGLTSGAVLQVSNDWHFAGVTPGNIAANYKIRATSVDNTNFYDEATFNVILAVDIDGDNDEDGDVDDDDDTGEETIPVIVAINDDTRELIVRKIGISSGGTLKINKTGVGKITLKKADNTTVLADGDSESIDILGDTGAADLVLALDGTEVGNVDLELKFISGDSFYSDKFKVKVVRSDIVQRSGNTYLAALIGEARTHSGIDWEKYVTDLYDTGIERLSLAAYESLADGGPDKKRLRLKKNMYMARRVWAKVYDNMDGQAYTLPTSANPWNLFTTSTNYITANCNELVNEQFRRAITEVRNGLTQPSQQAAFESAWYSGGSAKPLILGKHLVLFPGKSPMAGPTIFVMETALNYRSKCVGATTQFQNNYEGEILIFWYNTFTTTRYTAGSSCSICSTSYPDAPWYVVPFLELWDEAHHSTITPDSFIGSSSFEEITY